MRKVVRPVNMCKEPLWHGSDYLAYSGRSPLKGTRTATDPRATADPRLELAAVQIFSTTSRER